ncbi:ribonuclease R [Haematospirillum jordaniae]|uniref:Ribonuclease R n=1 Tax=Haematospirillum jordaniae TaxID=1549855 RepID=A0A143DG19_9PROT|nr:ribonuclease R [Haematospirillum jordaniae]AMW35675.1 RNAse R [Haematospirillum jordaniae]NKD45147.1 ribonuclease R [Haematospirillum jordaniae]NKD56270.1 ribonuclease R [Haematospirillum jordaniae]NKD58327.1 ribonuclease R [Haematospirillum jordaniae]NKD66504.1 ribonuclease R [Haematospirillum jordaniae]
MAKKNPKHVPVPTRKDVLDFIQGNPGRISKRELARAFNLTAEQRPLLQQIIKGLEKEGQIQRRHKHRPQYPERLPQMVAIQITGTDSEGELVGRPLTWEQEGSPPRVFVTATRRGLPTVGVGDHVLCKLTPGRNGNYNGHVIQKLVETPARVLGILEAGVNGLLLRPTDRRDRQGYVIARGDAAGAHVGELVEAEILSGRRSGLRQAKVLDRLGSMNSPGAVSLIAIHAHGIPVEFPADALEQAAKAKKAPLGKRTDLRSVPLVTIDGEDARDFDDAVWAEPTEDGGWHALVAIADVSYYVRPGTPLDKTAYERGNSVYFPDRVVPMLPEALSNGWCSLRPNEERPCVAVHMWFDAKGKKIRHTFIRGLMKSKARLTYTQVQNAFDGIMDETTSPLDEDVLKPLYGCFKALRSHREHRGALEITIPERKILVDDTGAVTAIQPRIQSDSHRLVEELMVAANVCAAETLESLEAPCMYRVHDEPPMERLENLRTFLRTIGLNLATGALTPRNFNHILERVKDTAYEHLVHSVVLRSQSQAIYTPENRGHFGLGLRHYAHFTSPIRRYADLLVHRALISGLGLGTRNEYLPEEQAASFPQAGEHISSTERRAAQAERDVIDRYTAHFMASKVGARFAGRVASVNRFGLFVELDETGANGLIPISTLQDDFYHYDEGAHRLSGQSGRVSYTLGDRILVTLAKADPLTGSLIFEIVRQGRDSQHLQRDNTNTQTRRGPKPFKGNRRKVGSRQAPQDLQVAYPASSTKRKPGKRK